MLLLVLTGYLSILGQVVLLRELNVAFYGVELVYLLGLGIWLLGTAAGALINPRRIGTSGGRVVWLVVAAGLVVPVDVAFIRGSRVLWGGVPGAFLPFSAQLAVMALALVPVSTLLGFLFQRAARLHVDGGRTLAEAYGIESLGGLAGGLASTLFLRWGIQNLAQAIVCLLTASGIVVLALARRRTRAGRIAGAVALVSSALLLWYATPLDRWMTRWNHPQLGDTVDTPYGRATIEQQVGQVSVFENDALAFETLGTDAEVFAHLAAIQHPSPRAVLVLGGGLEGLVAELRMHAPERIDDVELNRVLFERVRPALPARTRGSLEAPGVRVVFDDPRRFLEQSSRYDLILVAMPEPTSGEANRYYTREFFQHCAGRLNPGGVMAFRLRSAENVWTPLLSARMVSIYRALKAVFADAVVLPGVTNLVLASAVPLSRDPSLLGARFASRSITARLVSLPFIRYLYTNDRRAEIEATLEHGRSAVNSDGRPICYQFAALLWLSRFFPALARNDPADLAEAGFWKPQSRDGLLIVLALAALLAITRLWETGRRTMLVGLAGLAGMVLETALILHYQAKSGVLFQDIGLLLTSFMAGLAAGSFAVDRRASGARPLGRRHGAAILAIFAAFSLIVLLVVQRGMTTGLGGTALLLASSGALVAAVFAYASLRGIRDQSRVIAPLYAADLVGGSLGAVLGSLLLIPLAGLAASAAWMAVIAALALILI
jgi:spermidine synthase